MVSRRSRGTHHHYYYYYQCKPTSRRGSRRNPIFFPSIFAVSDNPSPIQAATSLLLTGAISVFLFLSIHRRAKRAKELKFRSSGAKKSLKEEALESVRVMAPSPVDTKSPPSPVRAFLGGLQLVWLH